ncbi:BRCA1-associated RING domain protein 1-like isoform X1 [Crotalus tigris]|uniref:BRCA1-associated RING domain protein 1-like isoform X1 n=3 Tax=Crotalus tigris TaxID=88082 RepID=UPI00192F2070|nr:BRCA1-associated RING domain protein 1-like isoform X1 [Crotalus tigris]
MAQEQHPQSGTPWKETRLALRRLAECLKCSLCTNILKKPVNLGSCEHVFCLSCVGNCIGIACPICQVPTMKQDVKINRKLDIIIKLYSKLQTLQDKDFSDPEDNVFTLGQKVGEAAAKKKQIKMSFSPRSRRMKFTLKTSPKKSELLKQSVTDSRSCNLTSIYDFISSPPHEKTFRQEKTPEQEYKKELRKKTLTNFSQQGDTFRGQQENSSESYKVGLSESKDPIPSYGSKNTSKLRLKNRKELAENAGKLSTSNGKPVKPKEKSKNCNFSLVPNVGGDLTSEEWLSLAKETTPLKCDRQFAGSPISLPKCHKTKEETIHQRSRLLKKASEQFSGNSVAAFPFRDYAVSSPSLPSPGITSLLRNLEDFAWASDPELPKVSRNCAERQVFLKKFPKNLSAKRNHKGESLLHTASIEGNLSAVECLLKKGADPNIKDYAGWTPLHEACNHGHKQIVELLIRHGALLNVTGYQNDMPLHDAARNGHIEIVELLLLHGASRDVVNMFGHKPVDYAETEEMKLLLMQPGKNDSSSVMQYAECTNLNYCKKGPVVLLGSGLDPGQQLLLSKLATVMKVRICTEFNSSVTHVVIPAYPVRTTMKCMLALLSGCWILTFMWVEASLRSGTFEQEEKYEIDGGPRQGRLNTEQLLPKLFDGCYFYFLGIFKEHKKDDLKELVKSGGGQILLRKPKSDNDVTQTINTVAYHAEITSDQSFCTQYIIYDASSNYKPQKVHQGKVWEVPSRWLIDCVMSFQLLPVKNVFPSIVIT